jgi:hypothetical protein
MYGTRYLHKVITDKQNKLEKTLFFDGILEVTDEKSKIRIRKSSVRMQGSELKCQGSETLGFPRSRFRGRNSVHYPVSKFHIPVLV